MYDRIPLEMRTKGSHPPELLMIQEVYGASPRCALRRWRLMPSYDPVRNRYQNQIGSSRAALLPCSCAPLLPCGKDRLCTYDYEGHLATILDDTDFAPARPDMPLGSFEVRRKHVSQR